ncbi:MAG TPA: YceI family protein [Solirubrobacteraceae bacterium]|jgi:polyisoprenoid-binding protein YceI|nr:YceI family protein [Solirubrobacteraceae bacterium]
MTLTQTAANPTNTPLATDLPIPSGTWKVDPVHSSVEFHVKHLGIATVKGQFKDFEGTLEVDADGVHASGSVQVASVDTREPQRDEHLRSADFFEVERFPLIEFASTAIRPVDDEDFEIDADLTIHGVTRPVTLKATVEGTETDPQGNERVGVSATAQIDRSDFGMKFNAALGSGNLVVSDKVKILVEVSAIRQS